MERIYEIEIKKQNIVQYMEWISFVPPGFVLAVFLSVSVSAIIIQAKKKEKRRWYFPPAFAQKRVTQTRTPCTDRAALLLTSAPKSQGEYEKNKNNI